MTLPDCSPKVLHSISMALDCNGSLELMRRQWGDETIDWLLKAEENSEFLETYPPAGYTGDDDDSRNASR